MHRQRDSQRDSQVNAKRDRQVDAQTERQSERQPGECTERQTGRCKDRETDSYCLLPVQQRPRHTDMHWSKEDSSLQPRLTHCGMDAILSEKCKMLHGPDPSFAM